MAEDFDIEALLEAPYNEDANNTDKSSPIHVSSNGKKRENGKHRSRSRSRSKDKEKERERKRSDRDKEKEKDKEKKSSRRERSRSKEKKRSKSKDRERERDKDKDKESRRRSRSRSKDKDKDKKRSKSGDRKRSKSREKRVRSKSPKERERGDRHRPDRDRKRERSRSKEHRRRRSKSPDRRFRRGRTPPNSASRAYSRSDDEIDLEERDARTIFCMQLSQRVRARDLEEFFSSVGKVRDVRLITCNKTKRFKGIAYIEFKNSESVSLALGLSGQKLLGIPISVQHTQAEKNRTQPQAVAQQQQQQVKNNIGPMRLYVGSLHFNITEDMLRGIFEPFGKIDSIQLIMDSETGRSKGYGFITFHNADDAKKALEQLNGFELAGRPMKVGNVTERMEVNTTASLDTDEMDRSGIDLGATGRLQLMFKLAEGAGLAVPQAAANALLATAPQPQVQQQVAPPIATQCFLLSNMFDPLTETNPQWDIEIRDEVVEECQKHGGILHVYVDKASPGNVYVKCPSIATAVLAVNALHGRWFAGRVITAAYVPLINYHALFPDAATAANLLQTSTQA
ncbi:RNA-binding protein 39 isoform X6 [Sitodiplosis mosellana]|uniref:RNA-binding protein 39 isoform X6 n=1 Tax=Sitodiplosis mosellana TaxID=263140 RepID=UPI002444C7FF|nr:RNA-binding protein 39 isoform X6 [Sitodiplosis mosellana]